VVGCGPAPEAGAGSRGTAAEVRAGRCNTAAVAAEKVVAVVAVARRRAVRVGSAVEPVGCPSADRAVVRRRPAPARNSTRWPGWGRVTAARTLTRSKRTGREQSGSCRRSRLSWLPSSWLPSSPPSPPSLPPPPPPPLASPSPRRRVAGWWRHPARGWSARLVRGLVAGAARM